MDASIIKRYIRPISIYELSEENFYGKPSSEKFFEQAVRKELTLKGPFIFVKDSSKAELFFSITSDTRKGNQIYGQVITFCNLNVGVYNIYSKSEEYSFSLQDIKGVQLDERQAAIQSVQNSIKRVKSEAETLRYSIRYFPTKR